MSAQVESKRPEETAFKQQRLQAWQPILTPKWVIGSFLVLGVIFIPIGIAVLKASQSVVEVKVRYDNQCPPQNSTSQCTISVTIPENMPAPVYFYYQLANFYQNHRRYVKSRSDAQLRGDNVMSNTDLASCDPLISTQSKPIYPCGLIANSFFNDVFNAVVCPASSSVAEYYDSTWKNAASCQVLNGSNWQKQGIAWDSDVEKKFKKPDNYDASKYWTTNTENLPLPDVTDEEFIVWMRTAGLPTFKKLHRRVLDRGFNQGEVVRIGINNRFKVSEFGGEKWVVLSTTSWLGGKNDFLGWAYIAVGIVCMILAGSFSIKQFLSPRQLGDLSYFHWNKHRS